MTTQALFEARRAVPEEERILLPPLFAWLHSSRRIRADSLVVSEVRWLGRRVDLVTLTASGVLTAYELKLAHITRALEQAVYNRAAFDRTFVVTASMPKAEAISHARRNGIGILVIRNQICTQVLSSPRIKPDARLRKRVLAVVRRARASHV